MSHVHADSVCSVRMVFQVDPYYFKTLFSFRYSTKLNGHKQIRERVCVCVNNNFAACFTRSLTRF